MGYKKIEIESIEELMWPERDIIITWTAVHSNCKSGTNGVAAGLGEGGTGSMLDKLLGGTGTRWY